MEEKLPFNRCRRSSAENPRNFRFEKKFPLNVRAGN
jgi:hypothetical protein